MSRSYDSALREEQSRRTRERVLDTVIASLARQEELSVPKVAKAAGVSVPTVYRYFPTREALMDAVQEAIGARLGRPKWPEAVEELLARVPQRYKWFEDNGLMMRAILSSSLGREVKRAVQRRREQGMTRALASRVEHLDAARARAVIAMIAAVDDAHTWRELRDEWRVSPDDAAWAAEWALRTLLTALEREGAGNDKSKRQRGRG